MLFFQQALLCALVLLAPVARGEPLRVITTTPDLAWLTNSLLDEQDGRAEALLQGSEDVHFVEAVPSYILKLARADIFCFLGRAMEIAWAPKAIEKSANPRVQKGSNGYCDASQGVDYLEVPKGAIDRSQGDVHPEGNPHYYASLLQLELAADNIARQIKIPLGKAAQQRVTARLAQLKGRLRAAHMKNSKSLKKAFGDRLPLLVQYHGNFSYFARSYGFKLTGNVEETPGVAPSAAQLAMAAQTAKKDGVSLALMTPYQPQNVMEKFRELSGVPFIVVPDSSQTGRPEIADPIMVQEFLIAQIIKAVTH